MTQSTKEEFEALQKVLKGFYLDPNPERAVKALNIALRTMDFTKGTVFYSFVRMIEEHAEVRAAFTALTPENGEPVLAKLLEVADNLNLANPLQTEVTHPKHLDYLWAEFGVTGNTDAVTKVIEVLDEPDLIRIKLASYLRSIRPNVKFEVVEEGLQAAQKAAIYAKGEVIQVPALVEVLTRCEIPIDYERVMIEEPLDLDIQVMRMVGARKVKLIELPIEIDQDTMIGAGLKFAALWSLQSFAAENPQVSAICHQASKETGGAARLHLDASVTGSVSLT